MKLDFSYFGIKIPSWNFSYRKDRNRNVFNYRSNFFRSNNRDTTCFYSQCTVVAPVWIAKASIYTRITLFSFTSLYMHLISPSVDSDYIAGWIYTFQKVATPTRVCIIPVTESLMLIILTWSLYWWHSKKIWVVWSSTWFPSEVQMTK